MNVMSFRVPGAAQSDLTGLRLDVSADHRAPDLSGLAEAEAETVTFAAMVRVRL